MVTAIQALSASAATGGILVGSARNSFGPAYQASFSVSNILSTEAPDDMLLVNDEWTFVFQSFVWEGGSILSRILYLWC